MHGAGVLIGGGVWSRPGRSAAAALAMARSTDAIDRRSSWWMQARGDEPDGGRRGTIEQMMDLMGLQELCWVHIYLLAALGPHERPRRTRRGRAGCVHLPAASATPLCAPFRNQVMQVITTRRLGVNLVTSEVRIRPTAARAGLANCGIRSSSLCSSRSRFDLRSKNQWHSIDE